jgi:predicted transcriptional regulator
MNKITLQNFCEEHSQAKAAEILECTQGAVSQMIKADREIFIVPGKAGSFDWYEVKRRTRKKIR